MDWNLFWVAASTIISLGALMLAIAVHIFKYLNAINLEIKAIREDIRSIDQRLSRLEGAFEERGRWESRQLGGK